MSRICPRTTGPRTCTSRYGGESARCSGSSRLDQHSASSAPIQQFTTFNTQRHLVSAVTEITAPTLMHDVHGRDAFVALDARQLSRKVWGTWNLARCAGTETEL